MHYPSAASARATTPADEKLGARIRFARLARGMSQERLAEALGVTFQQVQKYEKATNRIPATRLPQIATALGVPVTQLLPKLDSEPMAPLPVLSLASSELLSIYAEITPAARASLLSIARTIAVATAPKRCPHTLEMPLEQTGAAKPARGAERYLSPDRLKYGY